MITKNNLTAQLRIALLGGLMLSALAVGQGTVTDGEETPTVTASDSADAQNSAEGDAAQGSAESPDSQAEPPKQQEAADPRRPKTFRDALSAAGDDGIIVFCYGPDWNQRSVRMLNSFWKSKELEKVSGNALLLAVPIYEFPTPEQKEKADAISDGMPSIPFGVCPTVMMLDKAGNMYHNLPGTDYLGDEDGALGRSNIAKYLADHRKMVELMKKAEGLQGIEKAKVLGEVGDLPIKKPENLVQMLEEADPQDTTGLVRRNTHDALKFLYKQMDTKDGFLKQDFHTSLRELMVEGMKVVNDQALRAEDRQAAYCLLIGQARREEGGSRRMKDMIRASMKIDPKSFYGSAMTRLSVLWGSERANETREQRRERREKEKEDDKKHKEHEFDVRKSERNTKVE